MKDIELILNDEHLSKVSPSEAFVEKNLTTFLKVYRERKLCENCEGLFCRDA